MYIRTQCVLVLLVACVLSLFTQPAQAQSIPLLTDPIKVREVELMANKLELTSPQIESILEAYDLYLEEFARVRTGEVKQFEDGLTEAAETFGFMKFKIPERSMIEGLIVKARRAMRAIHRVDNIYFEEIAGMLSEKQRRTLQSIRTSRELEAYTIFVVNLLGEVNNGARVYLTDIYNSINTEANEEINEAILLYDQRYLKQVKGGFDAVIESVKIALDMIDELGVRGLDQQALMMRFMADENAIEDLKRRGEILIKPLVAQAYELSQLNWKMWNKLDGLLSEEDAMKLQKKYFSKCFNMAIIGGSKIEGYLDRALAFEDIDEGQRYRLIEIQSTFNSRWKKKTEKHAALLEKSRKLLSIAQMSGELGTEFDEELDSMYASRGEYIASTEKKIDNTLGSEIVQIMKGEKQKSDELKYTFRGSSVRGSSVQSTSGETVEITKVESKPLLGGVTIPDSVPPSFTNRAVSVLELTQSDAMIIDAVYDEYHESYLEVYTRVRETGNEIHNSTSELSSGERLKKTREASTVAAEEVALLDTVFFDDIAVVTGLERDDPNLMMLEHHRFRQRNAEADDPFGWRGGEGNTIDLVGLYVMSEHASELQLNTSEETKKLIRKTMQSYHEQVGSSHDAYVLAMYNMNHMQDAMMLMDYSDNNQRAMQSIQDRWRDSFTAVRNTKRALLLVNQTVMDELLNSLNQNDLWTVRLAFVKKAYPDVFRDHKDATKIITAASAIQSLETTQQSQLEDLATSFRYDYWNLTERMIENHQSNATAKKTDNLMNQEDMQRAIELETLRFERTELNDRARMRLRMILKPEQIKFVPGLRPSVATADEWDDRF